ncbi:hypothetical protein [Ferruginibacter albus]|uniref:hypothetical protein n=1 Tax=Ferruginibacter albus TaxID=2875540 RepID=UPI001CC58576|nr:hypothetical protein [Ferruginibacter albus]UAY53237.1 hypothetical protein K9M53_06090 [Ferruginibacter albus]
MKKIIVILIFCLPVFYTAGIAQVTVQSLLPQTGIILKSQLWNMLVVNNTGNPLTGYLVLNVSDRESGSEVLSATSGFFSIDKEGKQLNAASLDPIQYTYFSFSGDRTTDFLPTGSYTACFKLMSGTETSSELAETCIPFDVQPLSPPMLTFPSDSSVLVQSPGQFSWQPPAPLTMFDQLHYELQITEILPGQTPQEAIELNAPFYTDLNLQTNNITYTGSNPSFEKNKWYAWQVVAKDGLNYGAKTDVWDFKIDPTLIASSSISSSYILVQKNQASIYYLKDQTLRIKYYSYDPTQKTILKITDPQGKILKKISETIVYGDNFLTYDLDNKFKKGLVYSIEIIDNKNNKNTALFIIN